MAKPNGKIGGVPSGNGDPFRSFVIRELLAAKKQREAQDEFNDQQHAFNAQQHAFNAQQRAFNAQQRAFNAQQRAFNEHQQKINDEILQELIDLRAEQDRHWAKQDAINTELAVGLKSVVATLNAAFKRQERINRLHLREIRRLRHRT